MGCFCSRIRRHNRLDDTAPWSPGDVELLQALRDGTLNKSYEELLRLPNTEHNKESRLRSINDAFCFWVHFGDMEDIEKAIVALENVMEADKATPENVAILSNLGAAYSRRSFFRQGKDDIQKALLLCEKAFHVPPTDRRDEPIILANLGVSSAIASSRVEEGQRIVNAVKLFEKAAKLTSNNHPHEAQNLTRLGIANMQLSAVLRNPGYLQKAVMVLQKAVQCAPDSHPHKPFFLANLAMGLKARFQFSEKRADLDSAMDAGSKALELYPDNSHPDKAFLLTSLADTFGIKFLCYGAETDLQKAIEIREQAEKLVDSDTWHPVNPMVLSNLADDYRGRFQLYGDNSDLDMVINMKERALQFIPDDDSSKIGLLGSLGNALSMRFRLFGATEDFDRASDMFSRTADMITHYTSVDRGTHTEVGILQKALKLFGHTVPEHHPQADPSIHIEVGTMLTVRFDRNGNLDDVNQAIGELQKALQLIPKFAWPPARIGCLSSLCIAYILRFELKKDIDINEAIVDIDKALSVNEESIKLSPKDHPGVMILESQRCRAYTHRYQWSKGAADIGNAIAAGERALDMIGKDLYQRPIHLSNLANAYFVRFEQLQEEGDGIQATKYFEEATRSSTGGALERFRAALKWADCASKVPGISSLEAYTCAIDLLPQVASLGLPIKERHRELTKIGSAARDAAAAAIESGEYAKAIEWLDQGRSIVWSQLLRLRTFPDDLRKKHSDLADRLQRVATLLEIANTEVERPDSQPRVGTQQRPVRKQKPFELTREWDVIVSLIREVEGFEDFLLPKKLSQLKGAARLGTVVVINVHHSRCDALILRHDHGEDVMHVPLRQFSLKVAEELRIQVDDALSNRNLRSRGDRPVPDLRPNIGGIKNVLSDLWKCIVKPVLDVLGTPTAQSSELPRIWWCATGPLAFLPLHAAGLYNDEPGSNIGDYFVSSYTPTLTALIDQQKSAPENKFQILTVAQPVTPRRADLPKTRDELRQIHNHARGISGNKLQFISLGVDGESATAERVKRYMTICPWVHLACHGTQEIADPTKSALILHNGEPLEIFEIIKNPLPNAEFAFMSACQTASGDKNLPDEAVHLAASMLLAGYRGVIATMWSIRDADGPIIADDVYGHLFEGTNRPDHTQAALALHNAVRRLRNEGASFDRWVPFIHVGI